MQSITYSRFFCLFVNVWGEPDRERFQGLLRKLYGNAGLQSPYFLCVNGTQDTYGFWIPILAVLAQGHLLPSGMDIFAFQMRALLHNQEIGARLVRLGIQHFFRTLWTNDELQARTAMVRYLRSVEGGCQASKLDGGRLGQGPTWTILIKDKCCNKNTQCLAGLASHEFLTALRYTCVCNEHFRSHLGAKSGLRRYAQIWRQANRNPNFLLS